jgi:hypothetical protein
LGDGTTAVRTHLERETVALESAVGAELHRFELRDLLHERGDAHGGQYRRSSPAI